MREVRIEAADGAMDARVFVPEERTGALPAVVLFTDIGGLRPSYDAKAQRVADGGYAVLMPNVYYRDAAGQVVPEERSFREPEIRERLVGYGTRLTPDALGRDFTAILGFLDRDGAFATERGIGVVGYCMTGGFALRMAAAHPERVLAAAAFHSARLAPDGVADAPVSVVGGIRGRVYLGHADKDEHLSAEQIGRVDRALAEAGVHFATELFRGAAHGWTTADAPSYDAEKDALHYERIFWFLGEAMGTGG
ncbi:MAG: dienelactone hydrolase family protein [Gluconacetobacter diazotrophicus]|nr:dienelactone hydrolase family protein [Gluconacetobacter diazotrophicus]